MLTDAAIRAAKGQENRTVKLSDGGGLQLWLKPSGSRLWYLAYRFAGKQRKLALGPYPAVSLKDAREKRDGAKRLLVVHIDPSQQKQIQKANRIVSQANTFSADAEELWPKSGAKAKPKTRGQAGLDSSASPCRSCGASNLGNQFAGSADRPSPHRSARTIGDGKTIRAVIGEVFRYAIANGRAENDPTFALRGALTVPKTKHRAAIIEPVALGALLRSIDGYEGTPEVRAALKLLALTFSRPGELRNAFWTEFDLEACVWAIRQAA